MRNRLVVAIETRLRLQQPESGGTVAVEQSNTDPLTGITDSMVTLRQTEAAVAALKTSNDMLGRVIDLLG